MAIGFVGQEMVVQDGGAVTDITVPVPAGVTAGHYLIGTMATTGAGPITLPSGWTQLESQFTDGPTTFVLCYRIADGTEPSDYTWTHSGLARSVAAIGAYSGVLQVAPFDTAFVSTTVDDTTIGMGTVDAPANGWVIYLPIDRRNDAAVVQSWSTSDALDVRRGEVSASSGSGSIFSVALLDSDRVVLDLQDRTLTATQTWAQAAVWSLTVAPNVEEVTPTGIAATSAAGTPAVVPGEVLIAPTGIASNEAVGEPALIPEGIVSPTGVASQAAVGEPILNPALEPTGIASTAAVGTPSLARFTITWCLNPPTVRQTPMAWNRLHARYSLIRGVSIIQRLDGTYYTTQFPAQTELEESQRYWLGGYVHPLSTDEALGLIDAGFEEFVERESTPA